MLRRAILTWAMLLPTLLPLATRAQDAGQQARAFVQQAGNDLARIVNGTDPDATKRQALQQVVDRVVDVDEFGKFALGRFWPTAAPAQRQEFLQLFHTVLMNNLSGKISQYAGVSFTTGRAIPQGDQVAVESVVTWPNYAPYNVRWLVSLAGPAPKVIDVIAQGTSMRQTQRSDYGAFLAQHNADMGALVAAMRRQVGG